MTRPRKSITSNQWYGHPFIADDQIADSDAVIQIYDLPCEVSCWDAFQEATPPARSAVSFHFPRPLRIRYDHASAVVGDSSHHCGRLWLRQNPILKVNRRPRPSWTSTTTVNPIFVYQSPGYMDACSIFIAYIRFSTGSVGAKWCDASHG